MLNPWSKWIFCGHQSPTKVEKMARRRWCQFVSEEAAVAPWGDGTSIFGPSVQHDVKMCSACAVYLRQSKKDRNRDWETEEHPLKTVTASTANTFAFQYWLYICGMKGTCYESSVPILLIWWANMKHLIQSLSLVVKGTQPGSNVAGWKCDICRCWYSIDCQLEKNLHNSFNLVPHDTQLSSGYNRPICKEHESQKHQVLNRCLP